MCPKCQNKVVFSTWFYDYGVEGGEHKLQANHCLLCGKYWDEVVEVHNHQSQHGGHHVVLEPSSRRI